MTFHVAVSAQYYTISADSLLKLIQAEGNVYETIENKISVSSVDTKRCYFNDSLKTVLLKLLDEDEYVRQDNLRILNRYFGTDEKKKIRVGEWVYDRYLSLEKDSFNGNPRQYDRYIQSFIQDYVMSNDSVYNLYLDSAYTDKIHRLKQVKTVIPPYFEDLLSEIKWPEVYEAYYKDWVSDGKGIHSKRFKSMLRMHCPEAIELYNTYADEVYAKDDYSLFEGGILDRLDTYVYGSYTYQLMAKALSCLAACNIFDVFEDGFIDEECVYPEVPFNLIVAESVLDSATSNIELKRFYDRCVEIGIFSARYQKFVCCFPEEKYFKIGREIKENIEPFRRELLHYMKLKVKEELYWKRNMPYYKSEKDDKETRE
jgi:hypothetical protein